MALRQGTKIMNMIFQEDEASMCKQEMMEIGISSKPIPITEVYKEKAKIEEIFG